MRCMWRAGWTQFPRPLILRTLKKHIGCSHFIFRAALSSMRHGQLRAAGPEICIRFAYSTLGMAAFLPVVKGAIAK